MSPTTKTSGCPGSVRSGLTRDPAGRGRAATQVCSDRVRPSGFAWHARGPDLGDAVDALDAAVLELHLDAALVDVGHHRAEDDSTPSFRARPWPSRRASAPNGGSTWGAASMRITCAVRVLIERKSLLAGCGARARRSGRPSRHRSGSAPTTTKVSRWSTFSPPPVAPLPGRPPAAPPSPGAPAVPAPPGPSLSEKVTSLPAWPAAPPLPPPPKPPAPPPPPAATSRRESSESGLEAGSVRRSVAPPPPPPRARLVVAAPLVAVGERRGAAGAAAVEAARADAAVRRRRARTASSRAWR